MSKVHIVTDSACQIPEALREELDIHVVHLPYVWDGETYLDEIDMGNREFYSRLRTSRTLPTTSGPTPGSYRDTFERVLEKGGEVLVIHVGSEFSSTHKTAGLAKSMLPSAPIHLLDSHSNALGLGFQVLAVARESRKGRSLQELQEFAEEARTKTGVVFQVDDVNYLHRGGRINIGQRLLASLLNIVPVMQIHFGPIKIVGRTRSRKSAMRKMVEIVESNIQGRSPLRIGVHHTDNEKAAFELRRIAEEKLDPDELILKEVSPILGIHMGPGALGMAYSIGL